MKRAALPLVALCLTATPLSILAQGKTTQQGQEQEKLPVYFRVKGDNVTGQRLGEIVRTALQRNKSLRVVAEPKDATLRFYMVTVNPGVQGTAYSLVATLSDASAYNGSELYWDNVVGTCGQDRSNIEACAETMLSYIDQSIFNFREHSQAWYTSQLKAWDSIPSIGVPSKAIDEKIEGSGDGLCSDLVKTVEDTKDKKNSEAQIKSARYADWSLGYLSAYNLQNSYKFTAQYGVFGSKEESNNDFAIWWIHDTCKLNPKVTIHEVVDEYIRAMLKRAREPAAKPSQAASQPVKAGVKKQ